ncbi:hypothetical protein QA648_36795 (plasmid) [Rhizobium sp. CB3171]|uniref:phosphorylase family protein n=1 Tax=Rhizobium sp. CB3171 TaxID=3039157 RepID=UPI0024B0D34A|nr:hypothetical protein [Rhizobium sp. CB3171]WFU07481.1 hypothetical protein QA648_36795 [Rhizobium sp. CB3171]
MTLALARPTRMGADATGVVASSLATKLGPKSVAMSGVCAGNPKDVSLGDVIVAELAYNYEEGKATTAGFSADPRQQPLRDSLVRFAQNLDARTIPSYGPPTLSDRELWFLEVLDRNVDPRKHPARSRYIADGDWPQFVQALIARELIRNQKSTFKITAKGRTRVKDAALLNVASPDCLPLKIHVGPIASGASVNKTGNAWEMIVERGLRSALGLEMEAAVIANIAYRLEIPDWIVVKGVMDYADPDKDDRYKEFAARASAEVLLRILFREGAATGQQAEKETLSAMSAANVEKRFPRLLEALRGMGSQWVQLLKSVQQAEMQALQKSGEATRLAQRASDLLVGEVEEVRSSFVDNEDPKRRGILTTSEQSSSGKHLGFIRWSSGDEFFGEHVNGVAQGLGEYKIYTITDFSTPNLINYYSGEVRNNAIGKFGVYVFADRSVFSGEWLDNHPAYGYKFFDGERFGYLEFFGAFASVPDPDRKAPNQWLPHGIGIGISHETNELLYGHFVGGYPGRTVEYVAL